MVKREQKLKVEQNKVDEMFNTWINQGPFEFKEDCERIQKVIRHHLHVNLSIAEAALYWSKRSNDYDACWLTLGSDEEIVRWFQKFYDEYYEDE